RWWVSSLRILETVEYRFGVLERNRKARNRSESRIALNQLLDVPFDLRDPVGLVKPGANQHVIAFLQALDHRRRDDPSHVDQRGACPLLRSQTGVKGDTRRIKVRQVPATPENRRRTAVCTG